MRARLPKNFVLEERLERYADVIELSPASYRGHWAEAATPIGQATYKAVKLDLGCGKGTFLCEVAASEPDVLWIGVDSEPVCIAYTAQHIMEAELPNALVVPWDGARLGEIFALGELAHIQINFPTPFPRKKEATKRLVSDEHLYGLRELFAEGGELHLRTDHSPLFAFALEQLPLAGYEYFGVTHDFRGEHPQAPASEYEHKLAEEGAHVNALIATPTAQLDTFVPREPVSLMEYLPEDLSELDGSYLPHGMDRAIINWRNRNAHAAATAPSSSAD